MGRLKISSVFKNNGKIPIKYSCKGNDINPPFEINGIPKGTKSLVLIVDDPDAPVGTWDHWIVWNIPIVKKINENSLPEDSVVGINSWGRNAYGGPCPPSGEHRYFFKLYAIDTILKISARSDKKQLLNAIENHIIEKTELIGLFSK